MTVTDTRAPVARRDAVAAKLWEIESAGSDGEVKVNRGKSLRVSNLDKLYFHDIGRTKGDLMRYYERVSPWLLPLIADRPLVLRRFPDGAGGKSFFQQNAALDTPPGVRVETVPSESSPGRRLVGGDLTTLLYCVQLGAIDVNPWLSRIQSLEYPDYAILDLDPGPRATFKKVVRVARWLKELLDESGMRAGLKTSGSRGLHIVITLPPRTNEQSAQLVAQIFARTVAEAHAREATVVRSRADRPERAVYVDYLQNIVGKSVASAFSVRPRPNATVSTPLDWNELTDKLDPNRFTIDSINDELDDRGAMWAKAMKHRNSLVRFKRL